MSASARNRLAAEKSPYLLQHAGNPVDWYPWGDEAFAKARAEHKPIFLSVGYSTCHWCHVMERESFENEAVAAVMNDKYVCVKVDREERPDVDRVYMAYVQATTGSGGWPMSVFLTPALEPFFGGTYFPPGNQHGRPGFTSLLNKIAELWQTQNDDIARSATGAIEAMRKAESNAAPAVLDDKVFDTGLRVFAQSFDAEHAGFGRAPKFPRPVVHDFLLRAYARTKDERAAKMVLATLHLMSRGGMYDHLGGGFHRYSVDQFWHVPHFEKMLYDQAQLVTSCLEMLQITDDPFLARVTRETCDYVLRDLTHRDGGFFSAEDADSLDPANPTGHKIEGAFYVWTRAELDAILGADAPLFAAFYGVEDEGNADDPHGELTGKNVLHAMQTPAQLAEHLAVPEADAETRLAAARAKLFAARALRPRPHLDDKILTAWNGMMIGALARASRVLREPRYLAAATRAAKFVSERLIVDGKLLRRWRDGEAAFPGYLDDHAQLIAGLVELYQAGFDPAHLRLAEKLADDMLANFHDVAGGGFFATAGKDPSLLVRMKDDYDGAEPAGNSTAALALFKLAELLDRADLRAAAEGTLRAFSARMMAAPHALPAMVVAYDWSRQSATQVVIAGAEGAALVDAANARFVPHLLLMKPDGAPLPWLAAMTPVDGKPAAYVCRDHACERPVTSVDALLASLPDHRLADPAR